MNTYRNASQVEYIVSEVQRIPPPAEAVRRPPPSFVQPDPRPITPAAMSDMAGAVPLASLTQSPGVHLVELRANYDDRAAGFVRSTLPLWWAVSGAAAAIVLVIWIVGPLSGKWAFALGWWATSELLVLALTSVGVWAAMWWKWHRDGPDAIASRAADARLRMAEKWFESELQRTYGGDQ